LPRTGFPPLFDPETRTAVLGISRGHPARAAGREGEQDVVAVRQPLHKDLVLPPEPREWPVVRDGDPGAARRFGAGQHGAVGHRRPPVIAIPEIELRPVESEADKGAGCLLPAVIGDAAEIDQQVVARLDVPGAGDLPLTLHGLTVPVGDDHLRVAAHGRPLDARELECRIIHVLFQRPAHTPAQDRVEGARLRECIEHHRGRDRPRHHRPVAEDQHALDIAFELGGEIERQVGTHSTGVQRSCGEQAQRKACA